MSTAVFEPKAVPLRYPIVSPAEREALVRWVRALDARTLVGLLADRRTEQQLLAMRSREPALQVSRIRMILYIGPLLILVSFVALQAAARALEI